MVRHKLSTASALINFTDTLLDKMDKGQTTGVVFLDMKKAFDTVNHDILIKKLKFLDVFGTTLQWFNSYLRGRMQRTVCAMRCLVPLKYPLVSRKGPSLGLCCFWYTLMAFTR